MKKLVLLLLSAFLFSNAYSSHFSGGEIRYEFNGTNYDVYLNIYKICEGGAPLPSSASIKVESSSQNIVSSINMTFMGFDTTNINCPTTQSRCVNITSQIPGYITAKFKTTITLPSQANDWVISYENAARISSMMNITGSNNATMHLRTTIDNSAAINSNPLLASSPSYYIQAGNTTVIPLQAIDPEGDNIVYDLVAPLALGGVPVSYATGYSLANPFGAGGTATINSTNNTLSLNAPNTGSYELALRMREYRNSVLVGEHFRDFTVTVLPGTAAPQTIPAPSTNTNFTYYTCPGANNSIVLNFTDPTSTDSVYLEVVPPTIPGWTFNSTTTNGIPSASTTITWTTPTTLNPATLPFFYIKVRARDNSCPRAVADYAVVVRTRQCVADSVWPGDANGDFTVNIYDPLAIAIAAGQTGATRTGASTSWVAQACTNWTNVFVTNNTNMKHADCNGDGTVNATDLAAVTANYSKTHPKGGKYKTTGVNDLYLDMNGINLAPGAQVSIPVMFGSGTQTISDVYGLSARLVISGLSLTTAPTMDNTGGWLNSTTAPVNFVQAISNTTIDWALARTDQQNVSGNGQIATLNFTVPSNAKLGTDVKLSIEDPVFINNIGVPNYDIETVGKDAKVQFPESINDVKSAIRSVSIAPNPSTNSAVLNLNLNESSSVIVRVADITGKAIWVSENTYLSGQQQITLPANEIAAGLFTIQVVTSSGEVPTVLKWVKH